MIPPHLRSNKQIERKIQRFDFQFCPNLIFKNFFSSTWFRIPRSRKKTSFYQLGRGLTNNIFGL